MSLSRRRAVRVLVALGVLVLVLAVVAVVVVRDGGHRPSRAEVASAPQEPPVDAPAPEPVRSLQDRRPNIVLVSADDMRADELQYLPKTRRLLGEAGISFSDALSPHPLCCPARAELLTGQLAQNNGVRTNRPPQGGYSAYDPEHNVGSWLNDAGYNTAFVGKYLNTLPSDFTRNPGWTIFDPTLHGYRDYVDFTQYDDGAVTEVTGEENYYTDWLSQRAVDDARRLSAYDAPFFLWVSHFAPHATKGEDCASETCGKAAPPPSPRHAADPELKAQDERLADQRTEELTGSPSFDEPDVTDKQHLLATAPPVDAESVHDLVRGRIGALRALDDAVAALVEQLAADGELDNTYLAFVTDNGFLLGEHRWIGKTLAYEEALGTPLLIRGPGIAAGSVSDQTVTLVDLVPTWLEIAGARADVPQDGLSLLPLLHGGDEPLHPGGVLVQSGPHKGESPSQGWFFRGVRTERYTYLAYFDGWVELYDRERDPEQVASVADDPAYADVAAALAEQTDVLSECQGPQECNPGSVTLSVP